MKKICFFNGNMSRGGGTERATALIANALAKKSDDFKVYILSFRNQDKSSFFELDQLIIHNRLVDENGSKISLLRSIRLLNKYLKENQIDILVNVDVMLGIYSIPATRFTKTKLIAWEHFNFYQDIGSRNTKYVRILSVKLCDYYIVLTERDKKNFYDHLKVKCPLDYIYNPITNMPSQEYDMNSKIIMSVGNLVEIKGFDMLIDVAYQVLRKNEEWKWYIYGEGPKRKELQNKINHLGLQDKVILKGQVNNIEEYYPKAAIFVMTSRMEGLPMTLLEAKANKLPIVSFDIMTGPSEIIEDGVNGYLIEAYNINDMNLKIKKLIEESSLREKFSHQSIVGIDNFNKEKIVKEWIKVIEAI